MLGRYDEARLWRIATVEMMERILAINDQV
jgi:hypothetical protein